MRNSLLKGTILVYKAVAANSVGDVMVELFLRVPPLAALCLILLVSELKPHI